MLDSASSPNSHPRNSRQRRYWLLFGVAVLLLLLVVTVPPSINIHRFRRSIVQSISDGLGRPVRADAVELTLLPRPAFVLHNFEVEEDPAYGAEPVLTADTVTASLRASTLWHRRLEIATLHFDAPSLNLTRNLSGHWNFEALLNHSVGTQWAGPSARPKAAPFPFPYVEATEARINFKLGAEKLPFSLEAADLAVWKESGREWHLRLRAHPVRTDIPTGDAGQIRGEGVLRAAGQLVDSPVRLHLEWRKVEMGDISRILQGEDDNWRGVVDWTANAKGTLASLHLVTDVQIEEFRRAEFVPPSTMDLSAHCEAHYLRASNMVDTARCVVPFGAGQLSMEGHGPLTLQPAADVEATTTLNSMSPIPSPGAFAKLYLQHVPAGVLLDLFRQVHPGVLAEVSAAGEVNGTASCNWPRIDMLDFCTGQVRSTPLSVSSPQLTQPLQFAPLLLQTVPESPQPISSVRTLPGPHGMHLAMAVGMTPAPSAGWILEPSHVSLSASGPATLSGSVTSDGAVFHVSGPADLGQMFHMVQAAKLPVFSGQVRSVKGSAQIDLALKTRWLPQSAPPTPVGEPNLQFAPSQWTGSLKLHNATIHLGLLPGVIQLVSAQVRLAPGTVEWTELSGSYAHIAFEGNVHWQIPCVASTLDCSRIFLLHFPVLDVGHLAAALHPNGGSSDLLDLVNPWSDRPPAWPTLSGSINADMLTIGKLSIKNAALHLRVEGHTAELTSIAGNVFGGTVSSGEINDSFSDTTDAASGAGVHPGSVPHSESTPAHKPAVGRIQWGDGAPQYTLRARLIRIQPDSVAALWHEHVGPGIADAVFSFSTRGWSSAELAQHTQGKFSMDWASGSLAAMHPITATVRFQGWNADGLLGDEKLQLTSSKMAGFRIGANGRSANLASSPASAGLTRSKAGAAVQTVTGTITFARVFDLKLVPSGTDLIGPWNALQIRPEKNARGVATEH